MDILIGAVGRLKAGPEATLVDSYVARAAAIGRHIGLAGPVTREVEAGKSLEGLARQTREATLLTADIPPGAAIYVMDEHGKAFTSVDLSQQLEKAKDTAVPAVVYLIGGADGHGPAVKDLLHSGKARAISFGPATWPHMLARVMLCEQLYRAMTIMTGHPYHRA